MPLPPPHGRADGRPICVTSADPFAIVPPPHADGPHKAEEEARSTPHRTPPFSQVVGLVISVCICFTLWWLFG